VALRPRDNPALPQEFRRGRSLQENARPAPVSHRLENVAARKSYQPQIRDVFQGSQIGPFLVLAPSRDRYITMIPFLENTPKLSPKHSLRS
jgi:hypothetical protein